MDAGHGPRRGGSGTSPHGASAPDSADRRFAFAFRAAFDGRLLSSSPLASALHGNGTLWSRRCSERAFPVSVDYTHQPIDRGTGQEGRDEGFLDSCAQVTVGELENRHQLSQRDRVGKGEGRGEAELSVQVH